MSTAFENEFGLFHPPTPVADFPLWKCSSPAVPYYSTLKHPFAAHFNKSGFNEETSILSGLSEAVMK